MGALEEAARAPHQGPGKGKRALSLAATRLACIRQKSRLIPPASIASISPRSGPCPAGAQPFS